MGLRVGETQSAPDKNIDFADIIKRRLLALVLANRSLVNFIHPKQEAINAPWYVHSLLMAGNYISGVGIIVCSCGKVYQSLIWRTSNDMTPRSFCIYIIRTESAKRKKYNETDLSNFVGRNHSAIDRLPQKFVERHQRPEKPRAGTRREMQHHEHQHHRTASTDKCAKQRRHD